MMFALELQRPSWSTAMPFMQYSTCTVTSSLHCRKSSSPCQTGLRVFTTPSRVSQLGDSALARCLTQIIIPSGYLSVRQLYLLAGTSAGCERQRRVVAACPCADRSIYRSTEKKLLGNTSTGGDGPGAWVRGEQASSLEASRSGVDTDPADTATTTTAAIYGARRIR